MKRRHFSDAYHFTRNFYWKPWLVSQFFIQLLNSLVIPMLWKSKEWNMIFLFIFHFRFGTPMVSDVPKLLSGLPWNILVEKRVFERNTSASWNCTRIKATLIDQDSPLATTEEASVFPVVDNDLEGQPTHSSRKC